MRKNIKYVSWLRVGIFSLFFQWILLVSIYPMVIDYLEQRYVLVKLYLWLYGAVRVQLVDRLLISVSTFLFAVRW